MGTLLTVIGLSALAEYHSDNVLYGLAVSALAAWLVASEWR